MRKIFVFIMMIAFLAGCKKKLIEVDNPTAYNYYTYFDSPDRINEAVVACYAVFLHPGMYAKDYYYIFDLLGNDAKVNDSNPPGTDLSDFQDYHFTKTNGNLGWLWASLYRMVLRTNVVVDRATALMPKVSANSQGVLKKYIAEARFLRAYANFQLVTLWGRVPLRKSYQETLTDKRPSRSDTTSIWRFVEEDLKGAVVDLPLTPTDLGRATKAAAAAMLGKSYMYRKNWAQAEKILKDFPQDGYGHFELSDIPYDEDDHVFGQDNQNNEEIIFQVMHKKWTNGHYYDYFDGDQETSGGVATYSARAFEYGFNDRMHVEVSGALKTAFSYPVNGVDQIDPRAGAVMYSDESTWGAKTTYCDNCGATISTIPSGTWWKKYEYYEDVPELERAQSGINSVVIRYADVILLLAETYINLNNLPKAKEMIELIRDNRNPDPSFTYDASEYSTQSKAMAILRRERQLELCGEQSRFFDLVRWGMLKDTLNAELGGNYVLPKHILFPIPQQERATNPNVANDIQGDWN